MNVNRKMLGTVGTVVSLLSPLLMSLSATAQSSLRECLAEFVSQGVSPDKAADLCSSGGLAMERCVEKKRFRVYTGAPRQREDGRTEYIYPINAFSAENITGTQCWGDYRNFFNPKNVCWASSIKISVLSEEEAISQCRNAVGSNTSSPVNNSASNPAVLVIPGGGGNWASSGGGGSPQAIAQCMDKLMYRIEVKKPFPGWICVPNDVNCSTVRVRTEISDGTAAQVCQNAR